MNLIKIKQPTASVICQAIELDEEAKLLLRDDTLPADYLKQLIERELYPDAVRFLAAALPKREATWWACLSARKACGEQLSPVDAQAIQSAEAWVYKPTEENCKSTYPAAEATLFKTAAGWAAMAAFWSGGNMSPVEGAVVPPADDLTCQAVIGAVMLAAVQNGPERVKDNYRLFIRQGVDIAGGGDGRSVQ
ncbi:MAG: hypothetical protein Kow0065_22440 [Methylomicrobium sp.]